MSPNDRLRRRFNMSSSKNALTVSSVSTGAPGLNGLLPVEFGVVGHRRGPRDTAIAAPALAPAFPLAVAQLSRGRLGLLLPDSAHSAGQPWSGRRHPAGCRSVPAHAPLVIRT